jgi:outer membrane protein TolC
MKRNNINMLCLMLVLLFSCSMSAQRIMTLEECIATARKENTKAKDVQNDILIAKEQQKYARSKYFPTLGASASHFESSDYLIKQSLFDDEWQELISLMLTENSFFKDGGIQAIKKGTFAGVTMIEPLYTGGRLTKYNKLADLQVKARNMLQDVADDEIVMTTEFLYYKILELHEMDKAFEAVEKELANIHQDAVNIYENGIVNKNDLLGVELAQDQLSALRIKTTNTRNLLRRGLAKYIGIANEDIDVDTLVDTRIIDPELLRMDIGQAVENRTETQLLDIWVEKSVLERQIAKASMLPIVGLGGSFNYSKFLSEGQTKAVGFIGMQMPISTFWSERHKYKWKKVEEQKAIDFRKDKRELITLQVQDAYDNLTSSYRQTQIAEKSRLKADENLRIHREYYRNGLTNMSILLDAQRQQQQAMTQYNAAVSEYLQAKTRYLILTGRRESTGYKE